ncbi:multiple C2 and transmembrane domain-containing protein-like isoform X2 [Leptidea sinapis]|uniref:multiple C2 and transmembrane domain-containing protein-like isoform X2 n=1 Tax=Leptidea sinapis TaxID=189913 RepID=UPI0021C4681C|nr:multiple C2 and transmembrane domain-containing protein-like isoform X2 [Leptidea sinapis]
MENEIKITRPKSEVNYFKQTHISKLHERVRTKYDEMQRRLLKSQSIDDLQLSTLSENENYKNNTKYVSASDLSERNKFDCNQFKFLKQQSIEFECASKSQVSLSEIVYKESTVSTSELRLSENILNIDNEDSKIEDNFFFETSFKGSCESLNEVKKSTHESTQKPMSLRNRIGLKFREAKMRRQLEKEAKIIKRCDSDSKVDKFIFSNTTKEDVVKSYKRTKVATVTIALIEASGFEELDEDKQHSVNCRIRIGSEKRKSKTIKSTKSSAKFQELYNLNWFDDDNIVEMVFWDKDFQIGRAEIDLTTLEYEKTHRLHLNLEESDKVKIFILLTISGIASLNTIYNINDDDIQKKEKEVDLKYSWFRIFDEITDVGCLSVIVYGAKGLSGSDCYCILKLDNERLYTQTDYKTSDPNWMKIFMFPISDITSILEITVFDEKKSEIVGKVSIPLLKIDSDKRWYALKDSTQRERAKGNNPRILLELKLSWNFVKASIRLINTKELNYLKTEEKLDRHILSRNIARGKIVIMWVISFFRIIKDCFEWESKKWNIISLFLWILFCNVFEMWMLPLFFLVPFIWYRPKKYHILVDWRNKFTAVQSSENEKEKEEKSLRQKLQEYQEMIQSVQNFIGKVASLAFTIFQCLSSVSWQYSLYQSLPL